MVPLRKLTVKRKMQKCCRGALPCDIQIEPPVFYPNRLFDLLHHVDFDLDLSNRVGLAWGGRISAQYVGVTSVARIWTHETVDETDAAMPEEDRGRASGHLLREAFRECAEALYRFILVRVAGNCDAADEILQEVCFEAARHRRPPAEQADFAAWFAGIARNRIRKYWREQRQSRVRRPQEDPRLARQLAERLDSEDLPLDAVIAEESITQLMLALTGLLPQEQSVLIAFYFDGRSSAEIAAEWNITPKSVEGRLYRARCRLREALRPSEGGGK